MPWSGWTKDSTGPGDVNEKTTKEPDSSTKSEILRTEDNAKTGSKGDHSHVVVREKEDGSKTASGHGIRGGTRK